ncbi:MAG: hypothetical protein H7Z72_00440 [Bacteroidetes bacterium]|nr:hypothetical protein [Fibrella sp.]
MATDPHTTNPTTSSKPVLNLKVLLYGIIILLLAGAGYLLYRNGQLTSQFDQERSPLRRTVRQNQLTNDRQQLTFGMKTFVWAVRNALLQNKAGEVNEYFNTLTCPEKR